MKLENKKILVTGADEFIGSHLTEELIRLGSNYEVSIGDTVKLIAELMNKEIAIDTDTQRIRPENSEVERLWAENAKAKKLTGWEPAYGQLAGFKRGLQETIDWFINSDNLRQYKTGEYNI